MKDVFIFATIFLLVLLDSFSQSSGKLTYISKFRGYEWGESINSIRSKEILKYMQTTKGFGEEILSYQGQTAGLDARVDYIFRDGKLVEGLYEIEVDSFEIEFEIIKDYYFEKLDYPNYWASSHPNTEINWVGDEVNTLCRGPEMYWEYYDGFIAIVTEKYKNEITISIIYVYDKTILDYGKYVTYPYKNSFNN
jgi:hypothetical protein